MIIHNESKAFECNVCSKVFSYQFQLKIYYRTHTGEKPFACETCDIKFSQKYNLATHSDIVQSQAFKCDICLKVFTCISHLIRHYRTHTGEKSFACQVCDKKFTQKYDLATHSDIVQSQAFK